MSETSHPEESLRYLRALGDPDRLKIVEILRGGPKSVGEICRELNSPIANVSHHLGALKDVGIVSATKKGRFVIHQLNHLVESKLTGTHALEFGCCRIEFGENKAEAQGRSTDVAQALQILNQVLGRTSASEHRAEKSSTAASPTTGEQIEIVNASFESPSTPFFDPTITGWQKEGDPAGTGVFRNFPDDTPIPGSRFVVNADGEQLATIGARKGLALFQSLGATYEAGMSYTLTARVGVSSVQPPMNDGGLAPSLCVALTYIDAAGARQPFASNNIFPAKLEPTPGLLTTLSVSGHVTPSMPCAGKPIGILFSTADNSASHGGHFIIDLVTVCKNAG